MKPLPDAVYDLLKWLSLVFFNAVGVLYKTLATIWNLPFGEEVLTTCAAVALFIGALIGVSTAQYNKIQGKHEINNVTPLYGGFEEDEE